MAFGFPAYHQERVTYEGHSPGELMNAIDAVFHKLNWGGTQTGRWSFRVSTGISLWSWGETFIAEVEDEGVVFLRSECSMPTQCFDWGGNRRNVQKFLKKLDEILGDRYEGGRPDRRERTDERDERPRRRDRDERVQERDDEY